MNIFLSYASEDRAVAEAINLALRAEGHDVFFDREDLPAGDEFNIRIRRAIERADLFVFLASARAFDAHSYTINELAIAERTFKRPARRLLPVLLGPMSLDQLPPFLKSVTLLNSNGDIPAAVADAVHRISQTRRRAGLTRLASTLVLVAVIALASYFWTHRKLPQQRTARDGATAMLVPAGTFVMGDDEETPRREIYVDAFYLDRYEVTVSQYAKFLAATGEAHPPDDWQSIDLSRNTDLPIVGVDWNDAEAYCKWAGKRLPTDAEWEKAARGTDQRTFPWGSSAPMPDQANFQNNAPSAYEGGLAAVGTHTPGRSPFGIEDMAGNAAEWVADWYTDTFQRGDVRNPKGPTGGSAKVIRGGGRFDPAERITTTKRFYAAAETRSEDIGFRCASDS